MKNNILSLVAIVATLTFFAACGGGPKDQIARKWSYTESSSPQMTRGMEKFKADIKSLEDSAKFYEASDTTKAHSFTAEKTAKELQLKQYDEMMVEMKTNSFLEMSKDGKCSMKMGQQSDSGKWSISEDGKKLMMEMANGEKDTADISELSAEKLVIFYPARDSMSISFSATAEEKK